MNPFLLFIIAVLVIRYALELFADILNLRNLSDAIPDEFSAQLDAETYKKSHAYLRTNTRFGVLSETVLLSATLIFLLGGGFNWVDTVARSAGLGPIPTGLLYAGILVLLVKAVTLPFSIYNTFVIEQKFGFNQTTPSTYAMDQVKGLLLSAVLGGGIFAAILWAFMQMGSLAWLTAWIVLSVIQVCLLFIAPVVIMPLFNRFTPLPPGDIRTAIEAYAAKEKFEMNGVFAIDGSRRSSKSNAFFTGFGKSRRIALYDTLIEKHTVAEIVAIVAHELGHYRKKHVIQALIRSIGMSGAALYGFSLIQQNPTLFDAFGMTHVSLYASFIFFGFLLSPVSFLAGIAENAISRRHEYEADHFAAETTGRAGELVTALKKLSVDNLSNLSPHKLTIWLHYSHPPVLSRIRRLQTYAVPSA